MARSIGAVLTGFVFIAALSFGADAVLRSIMPGAFDEAGRVTAVGVLLLIQGYVAVFAIAGCYLAARLAGRRPMFHAMVLGLLGLIFSLMASIALWDTAPAWYHLMSLALVLPYAWVGGRLREVEEARMRRAVSHSGGSPQPEAAATNRS